MEERKIKQETILKFGGELEVEFKKNYLDIVKNGK